MVLLGRVCVGVMQQKTSRKGSGFSCMALEQLFGVDYILCLKLLKWACFPHMPMILESVEMP